MALNIDEVKREIDRMKQLLKEVKKKEEKSQEILESVKYVKYLKEAVTISKKQTKLNYDEAHKIWKELKKGTKFEMLMNEITTK